ncbi:MAG TPA: CsbD family protein [Paraburkholderia sp.]|uniref:CsbD family protein n=1 Tax=unclassified Paraburkholderia TaxID=2615204 RepID=UPI002E16D221|nr:CsbD family protein [Paraburkholderia sp. MPAMCS5]
METGKVEGTVNEIGGKVQQKAGELLGDTGMQMAGTARELGGRAQQVWADLADVVRESTVERPFTALAIAAAAGFLLGALRSATARDDRDR